MRVSVIGLGAIGTRAARQLASTPEVGRVVLARDSARAVEVAESLGDRAEILDDPRDADIDVAVLATPGDQQVELARHLVGRGIPVVTTTDAVDATGALLDLGAEAEVRDITVAVGAAFAPGLTCVLAHLAAMELEIVDEIHVARIGTAGPACARQHHRALAGTSLDWRDGGWQRRPAGSGRELNWFPDPIGAADCYRAELPDALLLTPAFPGVGRVTARLAATRRDRLTARLPMLRRPHPEAGIGGVRVEVIGRGPDGIAATILGAMDRPGIAGGAVAAVTAVEIGAGRALRTGAAGLAELVEPKTFLRELARRGVKAARFG